MKRNFVLSAYLMLVIVMSACEKTEGFTSLTDSPSTTPITVANIYDYLPGPTVKASKAENKITITLQAPSGRTIKEVTKIAVAGTASYGPIQNGTVVGKGTNQLWSTTVIPVNAATYTFTTTFTEAIAKSPTALGITAMPASNTLFGMDFYFKLTLDNGESVIPSYVRVWVVD
ncbi:MAG TPA: hypothetical protein VM935_11085 [Chitinophagaceae bacterium]|jgi:hypothetical protein|nr:hypothetical protein [Chitinophagaceae bacterium]